VEGGAGKCAGGNIYKEGRSAGTAGGIQGGGGGTDSKVDIINLNIFLLLYSKHRSIIYLETRKQVLLKGGFGPHGCRVEQSAMPETLEGASFRWRRVLDGGRWTLVKKALEGGGGGQD